MMELGNIYKKLKEVKMDLAVGIKHTLVVEGDLIGYHVAEISGGTRVKAHFHTKGDEIYHVLKGMGRMYVGRTRKEGEMIITDWEAKDVKKDDVFNIPEGYAHSLENVKEDESLIIGFICPHSHVKEDRTVINNPPERVTYLRKKPI
jgi:oxalate decarboxylase/phosphoglucose isomerase-like protein (cupin superfamily)